MLILVACEFSGRVRDAFIERGGHEVTSCDLLETESPGPHYRGDVKDIFYSKPWDLIIAHPPCTYLALSGVRWLAAKPGRWEEVIKAVEFFNLLLDHPCQRICVENPVMHGHAKQRLSIPDYTQKTQPYYHGHPEKKSTCSWLKGLPKLRVSNDVQLKMMGMAESEKARIHWMGESKDRWKNKSRTYPGIARAMAAQWG